MLENSWVAGQLVVFSGGLSSVEVIRYIVINHDRIFRKTGREYIWSKGT
jgi:hypothetical protein